MTLTLISLTYLLIVIVGMWLLMRKPRTDDDDANGWRWQQVIETLDEWMENPSHAGAHDGIAKAQIYAEYAYDCGCKPPTGMYIEIHDLVFVWEFTNGTRFKVKQGPNSIGINWDTPDDEYETVDLAPNGGTIPI